MTCIQPIRLLQACAAAVLGATAAAQSYYFPPAAAAAPGNAVLNAPFSSPPGQSSNTTRCMVVLDPASLPFPGGTTLSQLSLRRDSAYSGTGYAGMTGQLTVKIGRAVAAPGQIRDVRFARIWDGVPTTVYRSTAQAPFVVPSAPAPGGTLAPWLIVIPFQTTFTWQGGPLAVELQFTPATGGQVFRLDGQAVARPRGGVGSLVGPGCQGSNGFTPYHYVLPETAQPGAVMIAQMEGARLPPSPTALENFSVFLAGIQNQTAAGLQLPFSLASVGAPAGCMLRVDTLVSQFVVNSNPSAVFGRGTAAIGLPPNPILVGFPVYTQWLCFDSGVSASLGITMSDALRIVLGEVAAAPVSPAARTVWRYGAAGTDNDSGRTVLDDYGPVMRFN